MMEIQGLVEVSTNHWKSWFIRRKLLL